MTTATAALRRLETSLNQAHLHIARSIADDSANDRLREALECIATAKRAFDAAFDYVDPSAPTPK